MRYLQQDTCLGVPTYRCHSVCCSYKVLLRDEVWGHSLSLPALAKEEVALVRLMCRCGGRGQGSCSLSAVFRLISSRADVNALHTMQVDYYIALGSRQFVGNSVSVSSALLLMQRWHVGKFATYYNGGNIPLEAFMPLYQ